jgi:hypothetical protein
LSIDLPSHLGPTIATARIGSTHFGCATARAIGIALLTAGDRPDRKAYAGVCVGGLGGDPALSHLSKRELRKLAQNVVEDRYEAGTTIVRQGGTTSTLFVVLEGEAKVVREGRTISRRRPGEFFGEIALIDGRARAASVVAETPMRCLVLHQESLRRLLTSDPAVAWAMLQSLAIRLRGE